MDAINHASRGLQQAQSSLNGHAHRLATMATDQAVDPTTEVVGLIQAKAAFQANVQSLKLSNGALGALLDRWA